MHGPTGVVTVGAALLLMGCSGSGAAADPPRVSEGAWGGNHVSMELAGNAATLDFDCAHGSIQGPLTVDSEGRFEWRGSYVREHGGPIRRGEENAPGEPARYRGKLDGDTLSFEIVLVESEKSVGTFILELGKAGRVHKCL